MQVQSWIDNGTLTTARLDQAVNASLFPRFLEGEFEIDAGTVPYWSTAPGR